MPKLSVRVPEDLKKEMEEHKEINWSEVARRAFNEQLRKVELADELTSGSKLTEEEAVEIGEKIKKGMAEKHGLVE